VLADSNFSLAIALSHFTVYVTDIIKAKLRQDPTPAASNVNDHFGSYPMLPSEMFLDRC